MSREFVASQRCCNMRSSYDMYSPKINACKLNSKVVKCMEINHMTMIRNPFDMEV